MRENKTPLTAEQRDLAQRHAKLAYRTLGYHRGLTAKLDDHDAVGAANLAMTRVARSYDPSRGWKISAMLTRAVGRQLLAEIIKNRRRKKRLSTCGFDTKLTHPAAPDYPAEAEEREERHATLCKLLQKLPFRARCVVRLKHGLDGGPPLTFEEIGLLFSITGSRAQQIHSKAVAAMRSHVPFDSA